MKPKCKRCIKDAEGQTFDYDSGLQYFCASHYEEYMKEYKKKYLEKYDKQ